MKRLNVLLLASLTCALKNVSWLASCASTSIASILPRNRRASTLTWTRKLAHEATHRAPSSESPPPGTIDGERRLGRRPHQQIVYHALVLVCDITQFSRQRVHDMKVRHRQQLSFAVGQPSA
jgi:hypothetical protein